MPSFLKLLFVFLVFFFATTIQAQNTTNKPIKEKANIARTEGRELFGEGMYYQSLEKFQLFLAYRKKIYGNESYYLGSPYSNIGIVYKNLGQLDLALENFVLAEQSYLQKGDPNIIFLPKLYINIGNVYRAKLDYKHALSYFERALAIFLNQKNTNLTDVSDAYYSIAEINYLLGNYDVSTKILLSEAIQNDTYNQIYSNELLALIYSKKGLIEKALTTHRKSLGLAKHYYSKGSIDLAIVYMNYAELLFSSNNSDEALKILETAFKIIKIPQPLKGEQLSRYYELKASIYKEMYIESEEINQFKKEKRTNLQLAIIWYKKAFEALIRSDKNVDVNKIKIEDCLSFTDCLRILQQIGDAYSELAIIEKNDDETAYKNSLLNALHHYQTTSRLTQQARKEISSDESKMQLVNLEYSTFTKTIEAAYLAYKIANEVEYLKLVFQNAEQLKSSSVFDKLSNEIAQENSLIPDSLLLYEKKLNSNIATYNQKLFEENSREDTDTLLINQYKQTIFEASREREELNRLLEEKYADYYNLKYSKSMLSISEIQKLMSENEAIIEYVIIDPWALKDNPNGISDTASYLFSFFISKTKCLLQKKKIDSTLKQDMNEVFSFVSSPKFIFTNNNDSKKFCVASNNLYNLLIEPLKDEIKNKDLTIIPDGKLNYISFEGLISSLPDTSKNINFSSLSYLIKDYTINYANSANILFQNKKIQKSPKNKILAFAPSYANEKVELSNATYTLMALPGVQKEVNAISETIKTTDFRGKDASEMNFRENCDKYDIIHLAMHAYINDSVPAFSRLAFSQESKEASLLNDGWLNTSDIYNLDINARLTVLSACNTGSGKLQKGEGIMSLARGFLYAGCPSIIMSLWEVEDESGTRIISSFYENLKKGKNKDEALRKAKLEYLENVNSRFAHPHYWMNFKSIGDNSAIYTSYDIYFFVLLIFLIIVFATDQAIRIRKSRANRKQSK